MILESVSGPYLWAVSRRELGLKKDLPFPQGPLSLEELFFSVM